MNPFRGHFYVTKTFVDWALYVRVSHAPDVLLLRSKSRYKLDKIRLVLMKAWRQPKCL